MANKKNVIDEEVINHYGAVRLRVTGYASLQLALFSLDEIQSNVLSPIAIAANNNIEPNRLSNFTQQKAKLQIKTTNIGETFQISKLIVFVKPVAKSFPEGVATQVGAASSFVSPAIIGPTGPQGIQGIQGIQGVQGIQGPQGPIGTGTIPAFAETLETTNYNITGSYADVTGLSVTITPVLSTSKVLIRAVINTYLGTALTSVNYQILRGASVIREFRTAGFNNNAAVIGGSVVLECIDSPGTSSAVVYKIQAKCANNVSAFVNEVINAGDTPVSTISATEILQ